MSQSAQILQHLQKDQGITAKDARKLFKCERLAARIRDLRERGHSISTQKKSYKNADGQTVTYAHYVLED